MILPIRATRWLWSLCVVGLLATAGCGEDTPPVGPATAADAAPDTSDANLEGEDADSSSATDAEAADSGSTDAQTPPADSANDADSSDAGPAACPGGPLCPCAKESECDSGACIDTADGKQCAQPCSNGSCEKGFTCKMFGGADQIAVCVPMHLSICAPCGTNADCQVQGASDAWCLDRGSEGAFCGGICAVDSDCPADYQCAEGTPVGGGAKVKACQPKAGALCTCSNWAKKQGVATSCKTANSFGSCSGKRSCTADGLSACDAPEAKIETCNSQDDNCNGKIDDLSAGTACLKKAFENKGSGGPCDKDSECAAGEGCNSGKCQVLIGACPGKATCATSGEEICLDAKTPTLETCNGQDDDCDGLTDEIFSWVDPASGGTVTVGQPCGAGVCGGGTVQCQTINQAVCSTATKAGKEVCNGKDDDCNGKDDDAACEDGDPCTADTCDAVKAACEHSAAVDCDDKDSCTADSCDKASGGCQHKLAAGSSCSDGNACTVGDTCGALPTGEAACLPGASAAKCDDGNACTDDGCDPEKGCIALPNAATASCYDGAAGSLGVGTCHAGKKICKDGQLGECIDQNLPAAKEACDGMDDDCDGQTDEGCKGQQWQGGLVAVSGSGTATSGKTVELSAGGASAVGELLSQGAVDLWAGFARWLLEW